MNFRDFVMIMDNGSHTFIIEDYISDGICRVAVPFFFLISGILFFRNFKSFEPSLFKYNIKKRFKTIVIPFIIWSVFGFSLFAFLQLFSVTRDFFYQNIIARGSIRDIFIDIFIYPLNYQLWFLQELFILALASPLIYLFIKYFKLYSVLITLIIWIFDYRIPFLNTFWSDGILFFILGGYIAIRNIDIGKRINGIAAGSLLILWLLLIAMKVYFKITGLPILTHFCWKFSILAGVLFSWNFFDRIQARMGGWVNRFNFVS